MIIDNLLVSKSVRMNDIPIHILKTCKQILSPFLAQLLNTCVKIGIYPGCLKCAQLIPIQKGGQKITVQIIGLCRCCLHSTKFLKN